MTLTRLAFANARRSPLRAALTVLAVAISLVAFVLLRTVIANFTEKIRQTPNNRVVTRHKIGWERAMPIHYAEEVRRLPGIDQAMGGRWAGLKHPTNTKVYFDATAVEAKPFIEMHYELVAAPEQKRAFVEAVTRETARTLNCAPEAVDIVFDDVKRSDWASGGKLASDPK